MIHVCFCFTDKAGLYSKFVGTSMLSIFDNYNNTPPPNKLIIVHILHDNTLTTDNRDKFIYLAARYGHLVRFYNVEKLCADKIDKIIKLFPSVDKSTFTRGTLYRFFIPQVLPDTIEKAIYLDGDIIVNLDINELWQINLGEKVLAVVPEDIQGDDPKRKVICIEGHVKSDDYFNCGVLLMNLKLLRGEEETLMDGIKFLNENPRVGMYLFDQTVLNYCFSARTVKLPIKFDRMTYLRRNQETRIGQKIYHYATGGGLGLDQNDILNRLWMSYFIRTQWFDAESIGRLYSEFRRIRNDLMDSNLKLTATMSGKTRAFFIEPARIDWLKKVFSVRDDETIILNENNESVQRLIGAMKISKDKCVFFIMNKNFPFHLLSKEGFVEGTHFLRGWTLLSEANGEEFSSFPFIKAM